MSLVHSRFSPVASAAALIAFCSILSRIVGLVRDRVLIGVLGVGDVLDVYTSAGRVPDAMLQLLVVGALSAAFIPIFVEHFAQDRQRAWDYTNTILHLGLGVFGVCSLLGIWLAPLIAPYIAQGFPPEKLDTMVVFMRILFIGQIFFAASMVFGSVLQGARKFLVYVLAPIANNIGIMVGALVFVPVMGSVGLAWGAVLGAFCHFALQAMGVLLLGYRYRPRVLFSADVRQTIVTFLPRTIGLAVSQIDATILVFVASTLGIGSVTLAQYAYNINFFPVGMIGVSYAIAVYPLFCELSSAGDVKKLRAAFTSAIRYVLFLSVPVTIVCLLLRAQAVRLILGTENFSWEHTVVVADTLAWFAMSFFTQNIVFVTVRVFFAMRKVWLTTAAAGVSVLVNALGALVFSRCFGIPGLAMGFSLASLAQCSFLLGLLRHYLGPLGGRGIAFVMGKMMLAGVVMTITMQAAKILCVHIIPLTSFMGVFFQTSIASVCGVGAFLGCTLWLRVPEATLLVASLRRKALNVLRIHPPQGQVANVL
jgi:putative peptidoglycan lipid II flippase